MTFELEAGGVTRTVDSRGARLRVDGRQVEVDAVRVGHAWSVLLGRCSYEVSLVQRAPGELVAHVNGRAIAVRCGPGRVSGRRARTDVADARGSVHRVTAPMAGRIGRVLVKVGDRVQARQGLVVVEAMKMENELRSARAGTVIELRAVEGALVDANAVLVVLE